MKKYFIKIDHEQANHAGSKAVDDCEFILKENNYIPIKIFSYHNTHVFLKKVGNFNQLLKLFSIPSKSLLVIEHPLYVNPVYMNFLKKLKQIKKVKLVFLIHDLESVRNLLPSHDKYIKLDTQMYKISDFIICHNSVMKEYLITSGIDSDKIVELDLFDYLCDLRSRNDDIQSENKIVIAGNLNKDKSSYIYEFAKNNPEIQVNLYGGNFDIHNKTNNIHYAGSFLPEEIPNVLDGRYGLVWDGISSKSCLGSTGNYLRYNNPHKTSLYLVSELPVIVWKESAIAKFVQKNNVGLCVNDLNNLTLELNKVTDSQYLSMKSNAKKISKRLRNGYYLNEALKTIELVL